MGILCNCDETRKSLDNIYSLAGDVAMLSRKIDDILVSIKRIEKHIKQECKKKNQETLKSKEG